MGFNSAFKGLISCKTTTLHLHFFRSCWQIQDYCLQYGHEHFVPHPFQFIHCASCHKTCSPTEPEVL